MEASENASAALQIAAAAQRHRLGGQQLRLVRKPFQRLVRPELGLAEFAQLNEHPHLPGPGGGILRVEFQDLSSRGAAPVQNRRSRNAACASAR